MSVTENRTPYQAVLAKHGITHDDIRADIEHTALEQGLRRAGKAVSADLIRLVTAFQDKVAPARLETHYLLPPELQAMQMHAWAHPDIIDDFSTAYLTWLEDQTR
jgi:hypothetical protein